MLKTLLAASATAVAVALPAAAHADTPVTPRVPAPAPGATGKVPDLHFKPTQAKARRVARFRRRMSKVQTFTDQHGHGIVMETDNDGVDLRPFAEVLAATYHRGEIADVYVIVTSNAGVAANCGAQAVACYIPRNPDTSPVGTMVISYQDPDVPHTVFHEYGHHTDNQLYNLGGSSGCRFDNDGSRRWFFTRDVEDRIFESTTCSPDADWASLLGELYAEDFAQLSSRANDVPISGFDRRMPAPPPNATVLGALKRDIDRPFVPRTKSLRGSFSRRTVRRTLHLDAPAFIRVTGASEARGARVSGCATPYERVFLGRCKLSLTRKGRAKRYRIGVRIF